MISKTPQLGSEKSISGPALPPLSNKPRSQLPVDAGVPIRDNRLAQHPVGQLFEVTVDNSFDFLSAEYADLYRRSVATAFQHPAWLAALYAKLLTHNGAEALIVVVRFRTDGSLAMVLPLVRRRYAILRVVEFADLRVSDYASPVADVATFSQIVADAATGAQIRRALKPYDLLRINKLAELGLPIEALLDIGRRDGMGMSAYATSLDGSFPDWRQSRLTASYRKELDKKLRQLHRRGDVRFACVTDPTAIETAFDAMRAFRRIRFEDRGGGELLQIAPYFDFYRGLAQDPDNGLARTYTFTLEGRPIAVVLGLARQRSFLIIMTGFDHAGFKNQSIGSLMFEQVARDCIERGETILDFTIGDEPYKLTFGANPQPMWQVSRAGSPQGWVVRLALENLPAAKALARRLFHPSRSLGSGHAPTGQRPLPGVNDEVAGL
jgi:CelD/BcsL family acetyltransferase involved in cellulose biosynthesis